MEPGTVTFSDFIQSTKLSVAHILTAFFSSALGARAQSFLDADAKKVNTKSDDPRFLVNVIAKRWKQDFESQIPSSSSLPTHFEEVRNLFNIDAHSGQESWLKINYYVENLFAGLQMLSSFPRPYHVDTATALTSLKSLWNRVDRSGTSLNSDFKWEARLQDIYLPGLDSEELTVIISQVADSVTSDQVETAISITLGISPASCKKLPDGTFEVSFASAKDLNECLSNSLRIKNIPASVNKKQMPREAKYVISNLPADIPLELIKSGIELNLDCSVSDITKNANGEWEVVFGNEMAFEQEEVIIRKQKILLERKIFSASIAQTKILVYGPLNDYDTHKIEGVLDNILDVKCNAIKSEEDSELAVLLLSREVDSSTVLEHDNKKLMVAKNIWYFEPYCEHVLKVIKIPLGAKSEHVSSALAKTAPDCKLVYHDDKQRLGYVHCTSKESKDKLLMQGTLPLLKAGSTAKRHDIAAPKEVIKPDPLPVAMVDGVTASFKDSNEFVEVVSGNGVTDISFLHKGNLSRIQAKGFSHISTICDAKGIKYTIIDGSKMQLSTAIPNDVKEVMAAIQFQLKDREKDCVTVGEVDRIYTPIFKLMAKRLTNNTNCVVTIGAKPGKHNNQLDFVEIFLFGFKTDITGLKQLLSTMKRPISQDIDISNADAKLLADMPEALDAIKEEHFADFVFTNKVTLRALSLQCRDQAWQAALAEIKQRKEATKLDSSYCFVDFFDNYMRSDFQQDMFQKQLGGVSILTRGDKFIFNGPHSVVDKVKTELQGRLATLTSKPWPEKIDADLARHMFSTKKVQQILRENEVGYSFVGKRRSAQTAKKQENGGKKQPFDRVNNNSSPTKPRNKEKREGQKSNVKKSSSQIKRSNNNIKNKNKNSHKNKKDNEASVTQTRYYNKQVVLTEISFACQDANKLANCLNQLKPILQIQSVPLDVNFRVTKFIIQNINDIESKYKVIIRKKPYANIASASSDESDSDSNSDSDSSDDSSMSDAHSTASSDALSDAPKRLPNQCYITGMARNTIKAINYIKEYEKSQSWRQSLKLPALRFRFFETFKKDEVTMLCKKYNLKAVWPVHSVKLASSPSTSNRRNQKRPINTAVRRNELSVEGKKGDVEMFMQQMNLIAQGLFEESIQIPSTIPARILHLEKDDLMSQFSVVITVIQAKSATSTSADISDNDSEDDVGDIVQNQLQHTVIVVGSDAKVVSNACKTMGGPYETEEPKYTPQQFTVLFKELVIQKTINSFQSENTVHMRLDKTSFKVTLCGRRANIDAALNSLQVRLNGKFLVETITIPRDFYGLMRQKNTGLFNSSQQGAKVFLQKDDKTKLNISGDRNNVIALKGKLESLLADIKKDLHTETNSSYAWRAILPTDFSRDLMRKTNVILSTSKDKPKSYDRASVHLTNGAVIHLKRGDIFNETGSAIVSCDNEDMKPMGGIAKPIADHAGPAMANQVATYLSQFGKLRVGAAMTTGAGNLTSFASVIHVVGPVWSGGNANEHNLLSSAVRAVIDQAEKGQMTKVVMPSISTGVFGYPKKLAAEAITKELVQSMTHYAYFLKELVLIDTDDEMIDEFCTQFDSLHSNVSTINYVEAKNQWYWLENNNVFMPYDPDQNNQIELAFQTNQPSVTVVGDLNQVKNGSNYEVNFRTMQQRNLVTNWLRNVKCEPLPPNKWVKLEAPSLQASTGLVKKIHIHQIPTLDEVVTITGARKDVTLAIQEINKHIAAMTRRTEMDWHGGALDPSQVQYLESIGVKHSIDKRKLILEGFVETLDKAQLFLMKQSMYQAVKYPDHWDDQSHNCQLFVVDLNSQEGATVSAAFKTTMPNAQIVKVERVQNKLVWEDFTASVQKLRKTTGNTTQLQLFHGTRNTDPKLIYTDEVGFRNQFSSPQCYWGYGNYFAVNSSYSHNYAHYLPNGSKQMFMATVLVGDPYQAGSQTDSSLRVPPFKPSGDQRYDSVQGFTNGSTVYILYENGRAYPSYLITYN